MATASSTAAAPPTTTTGPTGSSTTSTPPILRQIACSVVLNSNVLLGRFLFRDHEKVEAYRADYRSVFVKQVEVHVFPLIEVPRGTSAITCGFGLIDHELTWENEDAEHGTEINFVPYLAYSAAGSTAVGHSTVVWTDTPNSGNPNHRPFPPGIQRELRGRELDFGYVSFAAGVFEPVLLPPAVQVGDDVPPPADPAPGRAFRFAIQVELECTGGGPGWS